MKSRATLSASLACLLLAAPALADTPAGLVTSFERIESLSYTRVSTTLDDVEQTSSFWRGGMGTGPGNGYSMPRVGLEYAWASGLSVGMCVGLMVSWKDKVAPDATIIQPRVGYALDVGNGLVLWPRLGLTWHDVNRPDADHTALSLEVPLLAFRNPVGAITFAPYLDLGLAGSQGNADQTMTELGLAIGFQLF